MAVGFAAHGAHVYICGRRKEVLDQAVREIRERSRGPADALVANVRDPDSIEAMMAAIWADGPLTGLVNNAAANFLAPTESLSPRGYEAIRSTVMDGSFYTSLACGKRWITAGLPGVIISNLVTWVWTGSAYVVPSEGGGACHDHVARGRVGP
jgi:NAD(P)-dependent dehydrogenase (short-subunit alcohol dehydrogenase family)